MDDGFPDDLQRSMIVSLLRIAECEPKKLRRRDIPQSARDENKESTAVDGATRPTEQRNG